MLLLSACVSDELRWFPEPIIPAEARALLVISRSGDHLRVEAREGPTLERFIDEVGDAPFTLDVLAFSAPLEELNLGVGLVPPPEPGARTQRLGDLAVSLLARATVNSEAAEGWELEAALSPELAELELPFVPRPCAAYLARPFDFDADARNPRVLVPLDDVSLLVSEREGGFYRLDRRGLERRFELPVGTPSGTALRDALGRIWLFGRHGRAARIDDLNDLSRVTPLPGSPHDEEIRWADGVADESGTEIFTLTSSGTLERFDGQRWTTLHRLEGESSELRPRSVARLGPGEVLMTAYEKDTVMFFQGSVLREVKLDLGTTVETVGAARPIPGFGIVAVSEGLGTVFIGDQGGFRAVNPEPGSNQPLGLGARGMVISPYTKDSFLVAGHLSSIIQYIDGYGLCSAVDGIPHSGIARLVVMGRDLVALGWQEPVRRPKAFWLEAQ